MIEEHDAREAAKLKLLQEAVRMGLDDIDAGRLVELDPDGIEKFVKDLAHPTTK